MSLTDQLAKVKSGLIAAHRQGDWEQARKLSQEKERLKRKQSRYCSVCDVRINRWVNKRHGKGRCAMCYRRIRSGQTKTLQVPA